MHLPAPVSRLNAARAGPPPLLLPGAAAAFLLLLAALRALIFLRRENLRLLRHSRELAESHRQLQAHVEQRTRELEQANALLREQNERIRQVDRAKSAFIANMSHEFRTPLNAILGFAEVLREGGAGALDERQTRYADNIHLSGRYLLRMVNEILDLSRIEAGQMQLTLAPFPLCRLLREAESIMRVLADRKRIDLSVELYQVPDDCTLVADEERIKETLMNLMANAIRFTPNGGRVHVSVSSAGDHIRFEVADTGIGIAPEDQQRIFEEFQQVDASRTREQTGTGLGLALARRFVQLHGGAIGVHSAPAQGSTFWFTIPLTHADGTPRHEAPETNLPLPPGEGRGEGVSPASPSPPPPLPPSPTPPLALVAEDDQRSAELIGLCLRRAGYAVVYAADGVEALAKARALQPSAMTLDLLLPALDGFSVLRQIKEDPGLQDLPVVVISVLLRPEQVLSAGAHAYLPKPIERERLAQIVSDPAFPRRPPGRGLMILLAEVDTAVEELVRATVAASGFRVLAAGGGAAAVEVAARAQPDLIVFGGDPSSPDGLQTLRQLRADPTAGRLPVLALLPADPDPPLREQLRGLADGVISRQSFSRSTLLEEVGRLLGRRLPDPD